MKNQFAKVAALKNDYTTFTLATATKYGLTRYGLAGLIRDGVLTKTATNTYVFADYLEDDLALTTQIYQTAVISGITALILYDLTDEMPWIYDLTFPKGYHPNAEILARRYILPHYRTKDYYTAGITTARTPNGNLVRAYSVERTLLDVWQDKKIEAYIQNDACQRYLESEYFNYNSMLTLEKLQQKLYPESSLLRVLELIKQ